MTEPNPTAAPDAELDRLLKRALNGAMRHGEGVHNATPAECLKCGEAISAIHAHVEQVKREAREGRLRDMDVPTLHKVPKPEPAPAPTPGDASGETAADFESALDAYRDELMSNTRVGASGGLRALEPDRTELRRLYRAARPAGAPTVWVATDDRGDSWLCTASTPAEADGIGEWLPLLEGPLTQPGTCVPAYLVLDPEGDKEGV